MEFFCCLYRHQNWDQSRDAVLQHPNLKHWFHCIKFEGCLENLLKREKSHLEFYTIPISLSGLSNEMKEDIFYHGTLGILINVTLGKARHFSFSAKFRFQLLRGFLYHFTQNLSSHPRQWTCKMLLARFNLLHT